MKTLRSITAATDFSREAARAVQRAARMAREHAARLDLLHVVDASPLAQAAAMLSRKHGGKAGCLAYARRKMDAQTRTLRSFDLRSATAKVRAGNVLEEIHRAAARTNLLVVGSRGQHAVRDMLLGSTAERLVQTAKGPVLVVKATPRNGYRSVIVPIDFSTDSIAAAELALQIAPHAYITFVHAYDVEFESLLWRGSVPKSSIENFRREARSAAVARIRAVAEKLRIAETDFGKVVARGYPPRVILNAAQRTGADLIAIGKQGRSLLGQVFIGSVTRHVLGESRCDVLVTRLGPPARRP